MSVENKTVWITGASSGIGEALAYAMSERGARLLLSSRNEALLEEVRGRCTDPARHAVLPLDLADAASLPAMARQALEQMGDIDILVHSGGISQRSLVKETSFDVDRRIMDVNYMGTVALTKAILPSMLARGSGHFVPISSVVGKFGTPLRSAYAASKHALHGFFDSLRAELADEGIQVTLICPGFVRTNVANNALTGDASPLGVTEGAAAGGMDARDCADQIIKAMEAGRHEAYIGGREVLGVYAKRFFPRWFARMIGKVQVT